MAADVHSAQPSAVEEVREGAFKLLSAAAQQPLAALAFDAAAVGVGGGLGVGFAGPSASPAVGFAHVAAQPALAQIQQGRVGVVALVGAAPVQPRQISPCRRVDPRRHLGHDLMGVLARLLHLAGHWLDLAVDELPEHVAEHLLLFAQLEVHALDTLPTCGRCLAHYVAAGLRRRCRIVPVHRRTCRLGAGTHWQARLLPGVPGRNGGRGGEVGVSAGRALQSLSMMVPTAVSAAMTAPPTSVSSTDRVSSRSRRLSSRTFTPIVADVEPAQIVTWPLKPQ